MKRKAVIVSLLLLISAGVYCGYRYYHEDVLPEKQIDEAYDKQIELFESIKPEIAESEKGCNILEPAEEVNSGVVGWITIPGTHIDYPICQAEDNDFYLHNGFDGQYNNELGCPFLDYRCESDFSGFNSIVYAHHMSGQRMFADISLFKDQSFFNAHSAGQLILNDDVRTVRFFAYLNVYPTAPAYHAVFMTDSEKREYLEYIEETADYCLYSANDLDSDDLNLLLLSTCTYEFNDARGILVGIIEPAQTS
ncbi:MAG: class B sortase [Ruminococcus sp.]|nr:class B sortase [Ruminococcus sp.]